MGLNNLQQLGTRRDGETRSAYEAARDGHAPTIRDLVRIEQQDIRASRVFEAGELS